MSHYLTKSKKWMILKKSTVTLMDKIQEPEKAKFFSHEKTTWKTQNRQKPASSEKLMKVMGQVCVCVFFCVVYYHQGLKPETHTHTQAQSTGWHTFTDETGWQKKQHYIVGEPPPPGKSDFIWWFSFCVKMITWTVKRLPGGSVVLIY